MLRRFEAAPFPEAARFGFLKAIVHIGTEKTGTSSIQKYLYKNRRRLRRAGFHVLTSAGKGNNRALAAYCRSDQSPDDYFRDRGINTVEERKQFRRELMRRMRREISGLPASVHTVIISSEHFHSRFRTDVEMNKFRKVLDEFFTGIKIVCYIREQVATGESWYSTTLKAGGTDPLVDFMQRCRPSNYYYNYDECLAAWEEIYGFDALDLSIFSREHFVNGDLLDDFTAKLDPALVGSLNKRIRLENESLNPAGQALSRALNIAYPVLNSTSPEIDRVILDCKKMINRRFRGKGQQLDDATRMTIFDSFRESNERVRARYFPDVEQLFAPPRPGEKPPPFPDREFRRVLKRIEKRLWRLGDKLSGVDLVEFYSALATSVGDVIHRRATKATRLQSRYVQFNDNDVHVLTICAQRLARHTDLALKLIRLVAQIDPDYPNVQNLLAKYSAASGDSDNEDFMLLYRGGSEPDDPELLRAHREQMAGWMRDLRAPSGMPLCGVGRFSTLAPDADPIDATPPMEALSVIRARSFEAALDIAAQCPHRATGGTVEVMSIFPFLARPDE